MEKLILNQINFSTNSTLKHTTTDFDGKINFEPLNIMVQCFWWEKVHNLTHQILDIIVWVQEYPCTLNDYATSTMSISTNYCQSNFKLIYILRWRVLAHGTPDDWTRAFFTSIKMLTFFFFDNVKL